MGLRLVNDYVALYIFGREGTKDILKDLVNTVLVDTGKPAGAVYGTEESG